jgi:glutamate racemase
LPIGIFDSGLGGLTTVKEFIKILPNENIVYFGDTGRVPYGTKSQKIIIKYAKQDINFLKFKNVKIIIIACGTVSSIVPKISTFDLKLVSTVKPTINAAALATKNNRIGIIGTNATIRSSTYKNELEKINKNFFVCQKACPMFVPLVENGITNENDPVAMEIVRRYLEEFKNKNIDTLILGCTHYPMLKQVIRKFLPSNITFVDSGKETAKFTANILLKKDLLNSSKKPGKYNFFISDEVSIFKEQAKRFLKLEKFSVNEVSIEKF